MLLNVNKTYNTKKSSLLILMKSSFFVMNLLAAAVLVSVISVANAFNRNDFPPHFLFGASTSAYQVPLSHIILYIYVQSNLILETQN
jgi:hypothetical protein